MKILFGQFSRCNAKGENCDGMLLAMQGKLNHLEPDKSSTKSPSVDELIE